MRPVLAILAMLLIPTQAAAERLVFVTDWKAQAEHGGFYQALAKGYYAARGLDVVIRQGGVGMDAQRLLAAGAVDAAMGSSGFFQLNLTQAGADVVTVAAMFQKDPWILMTHPRPDVTGPADMKDKPILLGDASVGTIWRWLKSRYGFQDRQIRKYTFNLAPFLVDRMAIQQGYVTSEPHTATKAGVAPQVFLLADHGYLSYAATIMVRGDWARDRPQAVRDFVAATAQGWQDYLYGDPAAADALIRRDNPDMDADSLAYARRAMRHYGLVDSGDAGWLGIGAMTPRRWENFTTEMKSLGLYPADLDWRKGVRFDFLATGQSGGDR